MHTHSRFGCRRFLVQSTFVFPTLIFFVHNILTVVTSMHIFRVHSQRPLHRLSRFFSSSSSSTTTKLKLFAMSSSSSSLSPPFSEDFSSQQALEDYAKRLVQTNKDEIAAGGSSLSVCMVIAGGGSNAISTLASTPGASSLLLEGTLAYDRNCFRSYLGISLQDVDDQDDFKYTSQKAAKMASEVALRKAISYRSANLKQVAGCIGIGCSSSLVSPPSDAVGIGYVVATRVDGKQVSLDVTLAGKTNEATSTRTRIEEDTFMSYMIFRSIELLQNEQHAKTTKDEKFQTLAGDSISQEWSTSTILTQSSTSGSDNVDDVGIVAANRVLEGKEPAVVLLPIYKNGKPTSFRVMSSAMLPNGSLVFPGSFNPPHVGHAALANAAIQKANSLSHRHDKKAIFMELSLTNADKPPIDPDTVSKRVQKFLELDTMPSQWGLILTRAPLFAQKVSCLQGCVMESPDRSLPEISFVIGTDTLVRIIDPKYYNNDENSMLEALRSMKGVKFFVGGRLEQKKGSNEPAKFVSGKEEIDGLPNDVKEKFIIIGEDDFRVDLSSSEIRAEQEKAATKS